MNAAESSAIAPRVRLWALQTGIAEKDEDADRLVNMGVAAWSVQALPRCTSERRVLAAQWVAFICVVDDLLDRSPAPTPDAVKLLMNGLLDVLAEAHGRPRSHPLPAALSDLWQRTAADAPEVWRRRFVGHYSDFAAVSWEEACLRQAGTELDLAGYLQLRRRSITMLPILDLVEHLCGVHLPDQWHENEAVCALKSSVIEAVACANDIASAHGELAKGHHNLVRVIAQEYSCSTSVAYQRAVKMVDDQVRRFDRTMAQFAEQCDMLGFSRAGAYAAMLRDLLYGTLHWVFNTARYGPSGSHNAGKRTRR